MAESFLSEAWGLQGAALFFISLRYVGRITLVGWRHLAIDDALMAVATVTYVAETTAAHYVVAYWQGLANSGLSDEERASIDPYSEEHRLRVNGSKTHVIGLLLYTTLMWLLKACWVFYYKRLTDGVHKLHLRVRVACFLLPATYISCLLVAVLKCIPFEKQWQISPNPGNNCQPAFSRLQHSFVMTMNTITDLYLMAIPLPMVYKSKLPTRKKCTLLIMFSGGTLAMAFGILRCVSILTVGATDPAQSGYWSIRESFVAVIVTNFPMVFPLIQQLRGNSTVATLSQAFSNDGSRRRSSCPNHSIRSSRSKPINPLSIPGDTLWDSTETVVQNHDGNSQGVPAGSSGNDSVQAKTGTQNTTPQQNSVKITSQGRDGLENNNSQNNQIMVVREYTVLESDLEAGCKNNDKTGSSF